MSAAIVAAGVAAAGAGYAANKNAKAQKAAAEAQAQGGSGGEAAGAANQQSWYDIQKANDLNRQNQLWAQQQNLVDQKTDFGSTSYETDPVTGKITATQSLAPEQQAMLETLRGKQGDMMGGMEGGFNVNNDVMQAMQAQLQPGQDIARNKENARLAAMGLSSGSGSAWGQSQDALNRSQNDANQKAVLGGFDAWQQEQQNRRANLAGLNATETGWANNAPDANVTNVNAPSIWQPENMTYEGYMADQAQANKVYSQDMANQGMKNDYTGQIVGAVGGLAGNKDVQKGVSDWWNNSGSTTGSGNMNEWGYSGGSTAPTSTDTGFNW